MLRFHFCFAAMLFATVLPTISAVAQPDMALIARVNASLAAEVNADYTKALEEMIAARSQRQNDYFIELRIGWLEYLTGNYEESRAAYQAAIAISQNKSVEAMLGLTLPLAALGDWSEVEKTYRSILALDPGNYNANVHLGQIHLNRGEFMDASRYLDKARALHPAEYEANLSAGWNAYSMGNSTMARQCFERVLMTSPQDTSAMRGLDLLK